MKIVLFILILLLTVPASAQQPLEPVRVVISQEDTPLEAELNKHILSELKKRRDVVVTTSRADVVLYLATMALDEREPCSGYASASLLEDKATGGRKLTVHTSGKLDGLAKEICAYLDKIIQQRRGR